MCFGVCLVLKRAAITALGLPRGIVKMEREDMEHAAIEALQSCKKIQNRETLTALLTDTFSCVLLNRND